MTDAVFSTTPLAAGRPTDCCTSKPLVGFTAGAIPLVRTSLTRKVGIISMANPTLVRGSTGPTVETLQTKLNKLGARPALKVDGIFGPITEGEVKKFQRRLKPPLKPDGKVGTDTWAAIEFELKGGKKPKLKIDDWHNKKTLKRSAEQELKTGADVERRIKDAGVAATTLSGTCNKEKAGIRTTIKEYEKMWKKIIALAVATEKLIAEFEAGAFRDPARVKAIQAEIDRNWDQMVAMRQDKRGAAGFFAHEDAVKAAFNELRKFKLH